MQKTLLSQLSKELDISEQKILDESISAFLEQELRNVSAEIIHIKMQFHVKTLEELRHNIEEGKLDEHPAWEQLIYWENLDKKIKVVRDWMQRVHISS
ncbi:MAG: hypothetical protein AABW64_03385 [Nanoarchaeota archaeon]